MTTIGCGDHFYANFMAALEEFLVTMYIVTNIMKKYLLKQTYFFGYFKLLLKPYDSLSSGTVSIMTMVVIGYDRFNVIVKGFKGQKITPGIAFIILITIWTYSVGVCIPPFFGWGGYALGKKL